METIKAWGRSHFKMFN